MDQSIPETYDEDWWYTKNKDDDRPSKKLAFKETHWGKSYQDHKRRKPKPPRGRDAQSTPSPYS